MPAKQKITVIRTRTRTRKRTKTPVAAAKVSKKRCPTCGRYY